MSGAPAAQLLAIDRALLAALEAGELERVAPLAAERTRALARLAAAAHGEAAAADATGPDPDTLDALRALGERLLAAARRRSEEVAAELERVRDTRQRLPRAGTPAAVRGEPRFVSRRA